MTSRASEVQLCQARVDKLQMNCISGRLDGLKGRGTLDRTYPIESGRQEALLRVAKLRQSHLFMPAALLPPGAQEVLQHSASLHLELVMQIRH